MDKEKIENCIRELLDLLGDDSRRNGLADTPDRVARIYQEIFRGYDEDERPKITTFQNGEDGIVYDNMVIDTGDFYSVCEHHMMPFFGKYYFAYIPSKNGKILGISKIGRVVDYCASKLQIQERLTHEIVAMLSQALGTENPPLGLALVMKGKHLCKTMRGAKKDGEMISSYMTGEFKSNSSLRAEFMSLIK